MARRISRSSSALRTLANRRSCRSTWTAQVNGVSRAKPPSRLNAMVKVALDTTGTMALTCGGTASATDHCVSPT